LSRPLAPSTADSLQRQLDALSERAKAAEEALAKARERESHWSESETSLREANETLRAVIRGSPLAIIALDLNARVRLWNAAAERLFGFRSDEVVGRPLPTVGRDELRTVIEEITRGRAYSDLTVTRRRNDGTLIEVSLSRAPVLDGESRIVGSVAMLADHSETRRLQQQVIEAQKMEAVGRLAGGIAHDFNNILSGIKGFAAVMAQDLPPSGRLHEEAMQILGAAERAETLTRHLLAFSRRQVMEPTVIALGAFVSGLLPLLRRLIGEDIELETTASGPDHVIADATQLEQIILNLAVNARDAMPRGGRLHIGVSSFDMAQGTAEQSVDLVPGPYVVMEVSDTGVGMDRATMARVFEPFFTTKPRGKGTGLGLATAYGIVKQSGGQITVASELGKGTRFRISLPLSRGVVTPVHESRRPALSGPGTETVLVAEDDDLVRGLTTHVLRRNGYEVLEAASGEEALVLADRHAGPIQLLVSDVVMPRMSGRVLADRLRGQRPDLRVLLMSGHPPDALLEHGVDNPDESLLEKPFGAGTLLERVRSLLDRAQRSH
jgi:two-component system, cell cycle sensor histidine kinase and response regulator CckA